MSRRLLVDFCGEIHELSGTDTLDFGRSATLEIDDNPFLHRHVGRFESRGDWWWLVNCGSRIHLNVSDITSRSQVNLAPGRELALTFPVASVGFGAGRHRYELMVSLPDLVPPEPDEPADTEAATISHADLPLTPDQRRLIVALAEPALVAPGATIELPANRAAARRLGWTITRFNRKLDNVCHRLHGAGVTGLRGDVGTMATDRRTRLVTHAIESGLITPADLELLD